jgi:hypothetical protein
MKLQVPLLVTALLLLTVITDDVVGSPDPDPAPHRRSGGKKGGKGGGGGGGGGLVGTLTGLLGKRRR